MLRRQHLPERANGPSVEVLAGEVCLHGRSVVRDGAVLERQREDVRVATTGDVFERPVERCRLQRQHANRLPASEAREQWVLAGGVVMSRSRPAAATDVG